MMEKRPLFFCFCVLLCNQVISAQTYQPRPTNSQPQLSADETINYINEKLALYPSDEYKASNCRGPRDTLSVSPDRRYILFHFNEPEKGRCTAHNRRIRVEALYPEVDHTGGMDECAIPKDDDPLGVYLIVNGEYDDQGEGDSSIWFCGRNAVTRVEEGEVDNATFLTFSGPSEQGRRLGEAVKHLTKVLQAALIKLDPADPFARPPQ